MAVDPDLGGRGLGAALLAAGLDRAFAAGAETVWANARDTALDFYRRHGFEVVDDGFLDPTTALAAPPHPPPRDPDFPFRSLPTPRTGEALRPGARTRGGTMAIRSGCRRAPATCRRAACARRPARGARPLLTLHRWAGAETWTSPRADELRAQLDGDRRRLDAAADELRDQARWLERQRR